MPVLMMSRKSKLSEFWHANLLYQDPHWGTLPSILRRFCFTTCEEAANLQPEGKTERERR